MKLKSHENASSAKACIIACIRADGFTEQYFDKKWIDESCIISTEMFLTKVNRAAVELKNVEQ